MRSAAPTEKLSPWAVTALVVGMAGIGFAASPLPAPILPSVIAMVLAGVARRDIARSRGTRRGRSFARAAFALGWIGICVRVFVAVMFELRSPWYLLVFGGIAFFALLFRQGSRPGPEPRSSPARPL